MGRIVLIVGIVVVLGGAAYLLWGGNNNSFLVSFLNSATSSSYQMGTSSGTTTSSVSFTKQAGTALKDAGSAVVSWVSDTAQAFLSSVSDTIQSGVTEKVRDVTSDAMHSVGEQLGVVPSRDIEVGYAVHVGTEASFAIRDITDSRASTTLSYTIDWGDGVVDTKDHVMMEYPYICTHTWNTAGAYTVSFHITRNDSTDIYTIRVIVRE